MPETDVFIDNHRDKVIGYLVRTSRYGRKEILLGMHHKQKKWNGFGGKVGDKPEFKDETTEEGLIREGIEEIGVTVISPVEIGTVLFRFDKEDGEQTIFVRLFLCPEWKGEISESQELLTPTWFPVSSLPWNEMWESDRAWLEPILDLKTHIDAEIHFSDAYTNGFSVKKLETAPF